MLKKEFEMHQKIKYWNIFFSLIFIVVIYLLWQAFGDDASIYMFELSLSDLLILALATFRVIRLFVYDNITLFLREGFMDKSVKHKDGIDVYEFSESTDSLKRTVYKLLNCPWCFGVWSSIFITFIYYAFPELKVLILALAVASLASIMQILSNLIGWYAEGKKKEVQR